MARRAVKVDLLVELVWADGPLPKGPERALRTYVTRLRRTLDPENVGGRSAVLTAGTDHCTLHLNGYELDADLFGLDVARGCPNSAAILTRWVP